MSAIGIPRVISAAGFVTTLGGGAMSARTRAAIDEAAQSNWRIDDLQAWAGGLIAEATGAEAGWVTSGAAAGLTLAAAACVAGTRLDAIDRLPDPGGVPAEIIVQRGHRNAYDRQLRNVGARLIEVGYPANEGIGSTLEWQLEAAFTDRTVAVAHLACAEHLGLPLERVCEIAHAHGVAVLVDAAAELPPRENLRRFTAAGADAVCFSGGKAIRGPQGAGLLATTHAIARSVRLQVLDMDVDARAWRAREGAEPPHHGLGRGFKVGPGGDRGPRHRAAGVRRTRPRRRGGRRRRLARHAAGRGRHRSRLLAAAGDCRGRPGRGDRGRAGRGRPRDRRAARPHARRRDRDHARGDPPRRP